MVQESVLQHFMLKMNENIAFFVLCLPKTLVFASRIMQTGTEFYFSHFLCRNRLGVSLHSENDQLGVDRSSQPAGGF